MSKEGNVEYVKVSVSLSSPDGLGHEELADGPESVRIPSYIPADDLGQMIHETLGEEKSLNNAATIEYMIAVSSVYSPPLYGMNEMVHSAMRVRVPREVRAKELAQIILKFVESRDMESMAANRKIPVRVVPREQILKARQGELRKYERRYEMSSEKMATLLELDAIRPTAEVLRWYQIYYAVRSLLEKTPTTGTHGTTTETSMKAG